MQVDWYDISLAFAIFFTETILDMLKWDVKVLCICGVSQCKHMEGILKNHHKTHCFWVNHFKKPTLKTTGGIKPHSVNF